MKRHIVFTGWIQVGVLYLLFLMAGNNSWATTHVVQFGGGLGYTFSPNTFSATVGDTVKWEGDFTMHPLSSTTIPANAQSWHAGTGTTFIYVIKIPGTYNYQCDIHYSIGMTGSFAATASGVRNTGPFFGTAQANQIVFVGVTESGEPSVTFNIPHSEFVVLTVFDLLGHTMTTAINQLKGTGTYHVPLRAQIPARGIYFVKLVGDGVEIVRTLRVPN